jgi:hypothetical protein
MSERNVTQDPEGMSSEDFITICHQGQSTGNDPGDWPFFGSVGMILLLHFYIKEEASEPSPCFLFFYQEEASEPSPCFLLSF